MNRIRQYHLTPTMLLAAALLLRAAIPAGFMPAAAGSGLLFEFCPEGIPAEFVQFLAGDSGRHHAHAAHGASDHHGHDGHGAHQCPVGHMLLSAAAVDDSWQPEAVPLTPVLATIGEHAHLEVSRSYYRSRGPPS